MRQKQVSNELTGFQILALARVLTYKLTKEFDPGSGRTLAARLTHASRTDEKKLASLS